ncbi:MAG: dihydroxyacetone kinase subunit DhaL [Acidobacteriota bacterium]
MIVSVSKKMIESKDRLTQADQAVGDGDHGVGKGRGFEEVLKKIEGQEFSTIEQLFKATGMAIVTSVGGAAGAVFGIFFRGAVENLKDLEVLNAETFSRMLVDGLQAVKDRGKAKLSDKTMVDALEPAAIESQRQSSATLDEALAAITEAARLGMEKTTEMVASVGKAKTLGRRSLGHADPGALSTFLILKFMKEYTIESKSCGGG